MSRYQASYYGEIRFKPETAEERFTAFIDGLSGNCGFDDGSFEIDLKERAISFSGYGGYYDMEIFALLTANEADMVSGTIEYAGEDDGHWKHELDQTVGHWKEIAGYTAYEEDGELLSELYDNTVQRFPELYRPRPSTEV